MQPTKLRETIKEIVWFCCSSWHPITVTFFILIRSQANISKWLIIFCFVLILCVCVRVLVHSAHLMNIQCSYFSQSTTNKQKYNITNNKTVPIEWWQREMFFSFSYNFNIRHLVAGEFFFYFLLGAQYTYKYMYMHTFNNYTHKKTKISSSYHFHNQLY